MFAEVLKRHFGIAGRADRHVIESAGVLKEAAGQPAAPDWATLQSETNVDLSAHRSRWVGEFDLGSYDLIYCMDPKAFEEVLRMSLPTTTEVLLVADSMGGIVNPWQKDVEAYRKCYKHICDEIRKVPTFL